MVHCPAVRGTWLQAANVAVLVGAVSAGCGAPATGETSCDPPRGPEFMHFANRTATSGVAFDYRTSDYKGGGLAVSDLDGDGLPEIIAGRRTGGLAVFENLGGLAFRETTGSGLDPTLEITAITAVDLDNDGDHDLLLATPGTVHVMANAGDGTFTEAQTLTDTGMTEQILPVDLDGDGRLDLYFSNYDLRTLSGTLNRLYMNHGALAFTLAASQGPGQSWTTSALDFDGDGDLDLYVANDTLLADFGHPVATNPTTATAYPDLFLRNDGVDASGVPVLTDIAPDLGMTTPRSSMGGVVADFDDDGRLDIYVPNYGAKKLFARDAGSSFTEKADALGLTGTVRDNADCGPDAVNEKCLLLSWSAALGDFDLDGYDEVIEVSGETVLGQPPPVLMFQRGAAPVYHEVSPDIGCLDARGLVVTDLDGDGDQDLVISQKEAPLEIYETTGHPAATRSLRVTLHGHASNREGAGAVVTAHLASGRAVVREVGAGGLIHSSAPVEAFFGLGEDTVDTLDVQWPSGQHSVVTRPAARSIIVEEDIP